MSESLTSLKNQITIEEAWSLLKLPGRPGRSCSSPFREDRNPSFSVFDEGRKFHDFATGDGGSVIDFISLALDCPVADAIRYLRDLVEGRGLPPSRRRSAVEVRSQKEIASVESEGLTKPSKLALIQLMSLRGLTFPGLSEAVRRNLLWIGYRNDDFEDVQSWVVTDELRRCCQARRLDGRLWNCIGRRKAWTYRGSDCAWPIGLAASQCFESWLLVEGGPDLLSGIDFVTLAGRKQSVGVCALLGASHSLGDHALEALGGKRVTLVPHMDEAGFSATERWADSLERIADRVSILRVDVIDPDAEDLNDLRPTRDVVDALEESGLWEV